MDKFRTSSIGFVSFLLMATIAAHAGSKEKTFKKAEIGEDASPVAVEPAEWPEAEFAIAAQRGKAFKPNEKLIFRAQWGIFRKAGQMVIETERKVEDDQEKLLVKTETASKGFIRSFYPMTLHAETVLDTDHWRMDTNVVNGKTRSSISETQTTFDYDAGTMSHYDAHNPKRCGTKELPYPYPLDYASALLQIRGWDLNEGESYPLLISSKGKFYFIQMAISSTEKINTPFGKMEAFRIEPVSAYPQSRIFREGGNFSIWVTADSRRIPLRFDLKTKVGTASMRLSSYELNGEAMLAKK